MATAEAAAPEAAFEEEPTECVANFTLLEKLMEMGVSATDLKRLKEAGFYTVDSLFMRPRKVRRRRGASPEAALTRVRSSLP
jgi:meiotic recombination protein DMC1